MRNMVRAVRPTILALSFLLAVAVSPGAAQFPPQGATADPDDPSIAAGTYKAKAIGGDFTATEKLTDLCVQRHLGASAAGAPAW
jgi:hypothetical protein